MTLSLRERRLLERLDIWVYSEDTRRVLDRAVDKAKKKFDDNPDAFFVWETIPGRTLGPNLPRLVRSVWIFIIRSGIASEMHRHPNSRQRTLALEGRGTLRVGDGHRFKLHRLVDNPRTALEQRWVSIPKNTWHEAIVEQDWTVLSIHSVAETDLIEEAFNDHKCRKYK